MPPRYFPYIPSEEFEIRHANSIEQFCRTSYLEDTRLETRKRYEEALAALYERKQEKKGETTMSIQIALSVTKVQGNKLILLPSNEAAQRLLSLSKSKFFNPSDLALARRYFGMEMRVVNGGALLSDDNIPERYRHYILGRVSFSCIDN